MKFWPANLTLMLVIGMLTISLAVADEFTRRGADSCLKCHDEESEFPVLSLFKTPHASRVDPDSPFANAQCETCHGPGKGHERARKKDNEDEPMRTFGLHAETPASEQNEICMDCHETHGRLGWFGSAHEEEDVACASCHQGCSVKKSSKGARFLCSAC